MTPGMRSFLLPLALLPALSACVVTDVAKTAVGVAILPVKVATRTVNAALPSQKKADAKRGASLRRADEERGRAAREGEDAALKGAPPPAPR